MDGSSNNEGSKSGPKLNRGPWSETEVHLALLIKLQWMLVNAHKRGLTSSQFEAKLGDGSDASEEDWKEIIREIHSSGTTLRGLESIRRISYLRLGRASPK